MERLRSPKIWARLICTCRVHSAAAAGLFRFSIAAEELPVKDQATKMRRAQEIQMAPDAAPMSFAARRGVAPHEA